MVFSDKFCKDQTNKVIIKRNSIRGRTLKKSIASVIVALGLFLSAFITSSAMAGSYAIGIIAATGTIDTKGSETEGGGDGEVTNASEEEGILYGSIFAEYTFGEMYGLTLGASYTPFQDAVLGTKSRTDTQTDADAADTAGGSDDSGTYTASATVSDHATIYVEPTLMTSENFGVYFKGGVARVTVNSIENITLGDDSSVYGDETVDGLMWGLGMKGIFDSGLMLKLEFIKVNYDTVTMTSSTGNKNTISADPTEQAVRLAIGYQF